jgi:hypothetical protein
MVVMQYCMFVCQIIISSNFGSLKQLIQRSNMKVLNINSKIYWVWCKRYYRLISLHTSSDKSCMLSSKIISRMAFSGLLDLTSILWWIFLLSFQIKWMYKYTFFMYRMWICNVQLQELGHFSALEKSIRGFANKPSKLVINLEIRTTFDNLQASRRPCLGNISTRGSALCNGTAMGYAATGLQLIKPHITLQYCTLWVIGSTRPLSVSHVTDH